MSTSLSLIDCLFLIPLIGSMAILLLSKKNNSNGRQILNLAIGASLCNMALFLCLLYVYFPIHSPIRGNFIGCLFSWQLDNFAITFVALTALLAPLCLTSIDTQTKNLRHLAALILVTYSLCLGVFLARHIMVFYIFFEVSLLPTFFIIITWGNKERIRASFFFLFYTLMGSIPLLVAIISILHNYGSAGGYIDSIITQIYQANGNSPSELLWWIMLISFAIKIPMISLHHWLPMAHTEAPTAGSMMLAGIMIKMGGYAMMRIMVPMFTNFIEKYQSILLWISVLAIIYSSIVILRQTDIKKMIAYSSVAHMGYVTVGIFSLTLSGSVGALFQMFSHGLISAGLFFMIGAIYQRTHSRMLADYGGLAALCPRYAVFFVSFAMANIGLPGTSGFVGEWLTINGTIEYALNKDLAIVVMTTFGMVLSAAYMLSLCKNMIFGQVSEYLKTSSKLQDINLRETTVCISLLSLIIILGLYPRVINNPNLIKEISQSYHRQVS